VSLFVLVHGGWHGAWCWDLLVPELTAHGHRAVAMDLPAGDPTAGAAEYALVVTAALDDALDARPADAGDMVLVGHSLAGLTLPLVAGRRPVRHVVYLAAMLPDPGRSVDAQSAAGERQTRRGLGRGQRVHEDGSTAWVDLDAAAARFYPDSPPDRARAAAVRLRRQQWRITAEPTPLRAWPDVPSTYVRCADDRVIDGDWAGRAVPERLGIAPLVLAGDHSPFLARPAELAALLRAV
jgi:hypothetical protein